MYNIAVSLNVVQGSRAPKCHSEKVEKPDSIVSPQPIQSKFGEGEAAFYHPYLVILMHNKL